MNKLSLIDLRFLFSVKRDFSVPLKTACKHEVKDRVIEISKSTIEALEKGVKHVQS